MKRETRYLAVALLFATLACCAVLPASAQHYVGFKGGYGAAAGRFYPKFESPLVWNKYNFGVMWKYYSSQQVVGGVSAELEYQTRGYTAFAGIVSDTTLYTSRSRTVNSITLPLIWQPHLYLADRRVRLFLSAGVTVSYNLGIGDRTTFSTYYPDREPSVVSETTDYRMITARDVRWNYGFLGGLGFGVLAGRWEIFAEARYYYGMSDILRTSSKYQFSDLEVDPGWTRPLIRSELDNLFITVGVFFRLGKGGITELPLRKSTAASAPPIVF